MMRNNAADVAMCPKTVQKEISENANREEDCPRGDRPPSPMPANEYENYVQHNKQMQVWDDWVTLTNSGVTCDLASISFKRVEESSSIVESKPKALKAPTAEELNEELDEELDEEMDEYD